MDNFLIGVQSVWPVIVFSFAVLVVLFVLDIRARGGDGDEE